MNKNYLLSLVVFFSLSGCSPVYRFLKSSHSAKLRIIEYCSNTVNEEYKFIYPDTLNNEYLRKLRVEYGLDTMTQNIDNEFDILQKILYWTHTRWVHDGNNTPSKSDPITILEEAKQGKNFRCVEYGRVSAAALNCLGIPARLLALKTYDIETIKYGGGHVAAECYLTGPGKWVFLDGQYNAIPVLNGRPLNAAEFREAIISNRSQLKIVNINGEMSEADTKRYIKWVGKYLYYLDASFDNRYIPYNEKLRVDNKTSLMLVPLNAKEPTIFQRASKIDDCIYTNNINDFYQKP